MKYSGEAKLSSGQRILEDMQAKLEEFDNNSNVSQLKLERMDRILLNVKAGIEHLSDKLISLKLVRQNVPSPSAFRQCGCKVYRDGGNFGIFVARDNNSVNANFHCAHFTHHLSWQPAVNAARGQIKSTFVYKKVCKIATATARQELGSFWLYNLRKCT